MNKEFKTCVLDTETTGTEERIHSPIEWALKIRINHRMVATKTFLLRPILDIPPGSNIGWIFPTRKGSERLFVEEKREGQLTYALYTDEKLCTGKHAVIERDALAVQNRTVEEIMTWPDPTKQLISAKRFLNRFIDPFDRQDKLVVYGWNGAFDMRMLNAWASRCGERFFMSYFQWPVHDVAVFFAERFRRIRFQFPDLKLGTVANFMGLTPEGALHGAMSDASLTEKIYYLLRVMRPDDMPRSYEEGLSMKLADRLMPRVYDSFGENIWDIIPEDVLEEDSPASPEPMRM